MSNGDFFAPPLSERRPVVPPPVADAPPDRSRWLVAAAVGVVGVVVLGAVALHLRHPPLDRRPVVLPDQVAGLALAPADHQFATSADWRPEMQKVLGDMVFDGRQYGTAAQRRIVNVMVMRGTSDEAGDARLGAPPWTEYGEVRCTHALHLPAAANAPARDVPASPDRILCVRTRDTLTVTAFMLGGAEGWEQQAAQVVDEVWTLQG